MIAVRFIAAILLLLGLLPGTVGNVLALAGCANPPAVARVCSCCVQHQAAASEIVHCCANGAPVAPAVPVQAPAPGSGTVDALLAAVLPEVGQHIYTLPAVRPLQIFARAVGIPHVPAPLALNCIRLI